MSHNWQKSTPLALISLVGVCAVWGSTFLAMQTAIARVPVMDFLALRFSLGVLIMIALRPGALRRISRVELKHGFLLGLALCGGFLTQTYGLLWASATVSGFITGLYVVLTPVMMWLFLKRRINAKVWLAVALATAGLAFISLRGWAIGPGEMLTLACAAFYAIHIVGLGEWSQKYEPYGLAILQIGTVAVVTLAAAAPGGIALPPDAGTWGILALTAILATAVAFFVQTWAQSLVSPTRAAVVMTMEPVFAGLFGVLLGGNQLTLQIIFGGVCIFAAMLLVSLQKPVPS